MKVGNDLQIKRCIECNVDKQLIDFHKKADGVHGVATKCKQCRNASYKQYRQLYNVKIKQRKFHYRQLNKTKLAEKDAQYWQANKEKLTKKKASYKKRRYKSDPKFAIAHRIRTRLWAVLRSKKQESTQRLTGCSWKELCTHLESKFQPGMSWENRNEWHIDHIRPLASFDLTDEAQLREACHYTNLQPLWAQDNLRKGAKQLSTLDTIKEQC